MKLTGIRGSLSVALVFVSFACWADSNGGGSTLFPPNQFGVSIFGETANGNVDSQPTQNTVYTTTSSTKSLTTVVSAPGTTGSSTNFVKRNSAKKNSPFATAAPGLRTVDPTVKVEHTTKRYVNHDHILHNAAGGGVMTNYYFNRYIGVSLEGDFLGGYSYNTVLISNLIFRYPFEFGEKTVAGYSKDGKSTVDSKDGKSTVTGPTWGLAPYVFIGGGCQWDGRAEGVGDVGGGLEVRFAQHYGVFVEGRWVAHDARQNYASELLGVSYNF